MFRCRLKVSLFTLMLSGLVFAADKPEKGAAAGAIKVVALDRKDPVAYEKDVEPIFVNKCQFCHSGSVKEGKFDISSFENMMKGGKRGKPVVAGKSAESNLVKLAGRTEKPFMPPRGEEPLTPDE